MSLAPNPLTKTVWLNGITRTGTDRAAPICPICRGPSAGCATFVHQFLSPHIGDASASRFRASLGFGRREPPGTMPPWAFPPLIWPGVLSVGVRFFREDDFQAV